MSKVSIKLKPVTILTIYSFLMEFESEMKSNPKIGLLHDSFKEFEDEFILKISDEQYEESKKEVQIAILMGRVPDNAKSGSIFKKR